MTVTLVEHHHPMPLGSIPEYSWVACVACRPLLARVNHGVALILCPRSALVEAVCHALRLSCAVGGVDGYHSRVALLAPARGVVVVDDCRARKHCAEVVGMECWRKLLPMHQVAAYGVSPRHILPLALEWVMLIEEVVFALIVDKSVGVVVPAASLRVVHLWTVTLSVERVLPRNLICLINLVKPRCVVRILERESLALELCDVAEYPVVGLSLGNAYVECALWLAIHLKGHSLSVLLVRDGDVEVLLLCLERNLLCRCAHTEQEHSE